VDDYIELVLTGFEHTVLNAPTKMSIWFAERLTYYMDKTTTHNWRDTVYEWRKYTRSNTKVKQLFISTVACLLQNGISWIESCFSITSGHHPISMLLAKPDVFQRALTSCGNAARAGFEIPNSIDDLTDEKENLISDLVQLEAYQEATFMILHFATWIIYRSLPLDTAALETHNAYILSTTQGKYVALLTQQNLRSHLTIPKVLLDDKFFDLARVWFLETASENGLTRYSLVGKKKLFGPSISGGWQWQKMTRVYGPLVEDSDVESSEEDEVDSNTT
jgi:hypothetical protein